MPEEDYRVSRIPHFLGLLGQYNTSVPIQSQWILVFESFPSDLIKQVSQYEAFSKVTSGYAWNISAVIDSSTATNLQQTKGCIFAQGIRMPPEGIGFERVGEYNGGYVKGLATNSRIDFGSFDASFIETNISFADMVLRPWSIMAAHKSLIARNENSLKRNITVYHLAKAGASKPMSIRKQFTFFGCVPTNIDTEDYSYEGEKVVQRQASFLYNYYTLEVPTTTDIASSTTPILDTGVGTD